MSDYQPTPYLTEHARQRCSEMRVNTKRVKRIVRDPSVKHVTWDGRWIAMSTADPDISVVFAVNAGQASVITVLWRTTEHYDRATFIPRGSMV